MELKSATPGRRRQVPHRFNRTFMELKSISGSQNDAGKVCFNRTFMELKCDGDGVTVNGLQVLIVPLWN